MHWSVGNCTAKRANINKFYKADLIFIIYCANSASGETKSPTVPELYVHFFSRYIPSLFLTWLKSSRERHFELGISRHFNTKAVSSQQFRPTPRTEHQCVPFCDYSQVQAKYRLNIALHFNPQPTPFIVTKCRHTIQLHILSVDTAI